MNSENNAPTFWQSNKLLIKGLLTGFISLIMLIPQAFISNLVHEREQRQQQVVKEVSSKWAKAQTINGPVLIVPYFTTSVKDSNVEQQRTISTAYILPDKLVINGNVLPEKRHRSLFKVMLYRSDLKLSGHFNTLPLAKLGIPAENVLWSRVHLAVGLNDLRGLEDEVKLTWNGTTQTMEGGVPDNSVVQDGVNAPIAMNANTPADFSIDLKLRGSNYLYFTPVGQTTDVTLQSPWQNPAFDGQYLPTQTPDVTKSGFTAHWKILPVSHSYPQYWKDGSHDLTTAAFGVKMLQPMNSYVKTDRSVKYALLFISLTFTVFFFLEVFQKKQIHPLQYILVALALCIFYTLLLSFSEYIGYNWAYTIATAATVILIGSYVKGIFHSLKTGLIFSVALLGLYTYIFVLIQLEDYALLFGSIGLFVVMAVIMYYSRKIDWYHTEKTHYLPTEDQPYTP